MSRFIKAKLNQFMNFWDDNNYKVMNVLSYIFLFITPIISVIHLSCYPGNIAGSIAIGLITLFFGLVFKELSKFYAPYVGIPVLDHRLTTRGSDRVDIEYGNVPMMIQYLGDLEDWLEANGYF